MPLPERATGEASTIIPNTFSQPASLELRTRRGVFAGILGALVVVFAAWLAILPSSERDWQHINERVKAANDDPRFSVRIREGLPRMSLERGGAGVTR